MRYGDAGPGPKGTVRNGLFQFEGQQLMALNGGSHFKFTEAISLFVRCEAQEEVDYYWEKLTADGGAPSKCGWLKAKFGLSWQLIPSALMELMADKDPEKPKRVMEAMLQMSKIDVNKLKQAYDQGQTPSLGERRATC